MVITSSRRTDEREHIITHVGKGPIRIARSTQQEFCRICQFPRPRDGHLLNFSEHRCLSPNCSLNLVNHSPRGFEWGYAGSELAQFAYGLLLDYYDKEQFVRDNYIAFRNQLECDGPAAYWHFTGEEIDATMATITDDVAPSPTVANSRRRIPRTGGLSPGPTDTSSSELIEIITLCSERTPTSASRRWDSVTDG